MSNDNIGLLNNVEYITSSYILEILHVCERAKEEYKSKRQELSNIDHLLEDIYHLIEFNTFNAATGYILARKIKECRIKRRKIKNESELLQSL